MHLSFLSIWAVTPFILSVSAKARRATVTRITTTTVTSTPITTIAPVCGPPTSAPGASTGTGVVARAAVEERAASLQDNDRRSPKKPKPKSTVTVESTRTKTITLSTKTVVGPVQTPTSFWLWSSKSSRYAVNGDSGPEGTTFSVDQPSSPLSPAGNFTLNAANGQLLLQNPQLFNGSMAACSVGPPTYGIHYYFCSLQNDPYLTCDISAVEYGSGYACGLFCQVQFGSQLNNISAVFQGGVPGWGIFSSVAEAERLDYSTFVPMVQGID